MRRAATSTWTLTIPPEDVAIAVGRALNEALGDRAGIARFADRTVPLDEALIQVALDLSGRPYAAIDLDFPAADDWGVAFVDGEAHS